MRRRRRALKLPADFIYFSGGEKRGASAADSDLRPAPKLLLGGIFALGEKSQILVCGRRAPPVPGEALIFSFPGCHFSA